MKEAIKAVTTSHLRESLPICIKKWLSITPTQISNKRRERKREKDAKKRLFFCNINKIINIKREACIWQGQD